LRQGLHGIAQEENQRKEAGKNSHSVRHPKESIRGITLEFKRYTSSC
jgi:hypothetical protein